MDQRAVAQAVAKTSAYIRCGKHQDAEEWFVRLTHQLGMNHLLVSQPLGTDELDI